MYILQLLNNFNVATYSVSMIVVLSRFAHNLKPE